MKKILFGLLKIVLIISLIVLLTFGVWMYFRGAQPMAVPAARGITFWQFIQERWDAFISVDTQISMLPQYQGCRNDILRLLPINMRGSFNFAYATAYPQSEMALAFKYWEEKKPDPVLPKLKEGSFMDIPDAFWSYFESAYWRGLVSMDYLADECQLGPVNFNSILRGN